MDKIEFEIITLFWEKTDYKDFPTTSGLYQIYGTSPLYGIDTLLYIGKASNLNSRIKDHFEFRDAMIGRQPNKSCRYTTLDSSMLDIAEQILIVMHKPSFNSARLIQLGEAVRAKPYYIQNHGDRGMLNIENTNFYFLDKTIDVVIPPDIQLDIR